MKLDVIAKGEYGVAYFETSSIRTTTIGNTVYYNYADLLDNFKLANTKALLAKLGTECKVVKMLNGNGNPAAMRAVTIKGLQMIWAYATSGEGKVRKPKKDKEPTEPEEKIQPSEGESVATSTSETDETDKKVVAKTQPATQQQEVVPEDNPAEVEVNNDQQEEVGKNQSIIAYDAFGQPLTQEEVDAHNAVLDDIDHTVGITRTKDGLDAEVAEELPIPSLGSPKEATDSEVDVETTKEVAESDIPSIQESTPTKEESVVEEIPEEVVEEKSSTSTGTEDADEDESDALDEVEDYETFVDLGGQTVALIPTEDGGYIATPPKNKQVKDDVPPATEPPVYFTDSRLLRTWLEEASEDSPKDDNIKEDEDAEEDEDIIRFEDEESLADDPSETAIPTLDTEDDVFRWIALMDTAILNGSQVPLIEKQARHSKLWMVFVNNEWWTPVRSLCAILSSFHRNKELQEELIRMCGEERPSSYLPLSIQMIQKKSSTARLGLLVYKGLWWASVRDTRVWLDKFPDYPLLDELEAELMDWTGLPYRNQAMIDVKREVCRNYLTMHDESRGNEIYENLIRQFKKSKEVLDRFGRKNPYCPLL